MPTCGQLEIHFSLGDNHHFMTINLHMHTLTEHTHSHPHTSHTVHFVIYWRNVKLSAVIFAMCLVGLFLTIQYTFIHTVVLLLLLSLVVCFICITVKIAIDFFYNREIKLLFRYQC